MPFSMVYKLEDSVCELAELSQLPEYLPTRGLADSIVNDPALADQPDFLDSKPWLSSKFTLWALANNPKRNTVKKIRLRKFHLR
jgi:hypothetical protein